MRILDAESMGRVDSRAIEELGIPSMVLMENAALAVVDTIGEELPEVESVAIFCGSGNNGGDGMAVGRHLAIRGYGVELFLVGDREPGGDAAKQLAICRGIGLDVRRIATGEELRGVLAEADGWDAIVDALFGTGLSRPLKGLWADVVEGLGRVRSPVVAVDIPSGLDGSSPEPPGPHLRADVTVTFGAPKIPHVLPPACHSVGLLVVGDLGIPPSFVEEAPGGISMLEAGDVAGLLPQREPTSHKGTYGHLLVVAGAPGTSGAATLAARGAVRSGAGLVTVGVPEACVPVVDGASLESMTLGLPGDSLDDEGVDRLLDDLDRFDALALGPGLGREEGTAAAIRRLVGEAGCPLVLDADGVNAFAGRARDLRERSAFTVITPHPGELARLLDVPIGEILGDRLGIAVSAAEDTGAVVLLKGWRTLVASPDGRVVVNVTGNPGMASGGSGDVLTGVVGSLVAQGLDGREAAAVGAFVHGLAGDVAAAEGSEPSLSAGDLVEALPTAFRRLLSGR